MELKFINSVPCIYLCTIHTNKHFLGGGAGEDVVNLNKKEKKQILIILLNKSFLKNLMSSDD